MAKIKISGKQDLVEIANDKAKKINDFWLDIDIPNDEKIKIGTVTVIKRDIRAIFLDEKLSDGGEVFAEEIRAYWRRRLALLEMSAKERADATAWGHFSLLYWALNKKAPDEAMRQEVLDEAVKFYEENPQWTIVSVMRWFKLLGVTKESEHHANSHAMRILQRVEGNELDAIKNEKLYQQQMKDSDKREEEILSKTAYKKSEIEF